MATNVTLINCDNKPVSVLADSVGEGALGQVSLLRTDAFVNFGDPSVSYNQVIAESGFLDSGPRKSALDIYGRTETAEALATAYAELLNERRINLFNRVVQKEGLSEADAIVNSIYDETVSTLNLDELYTDCESLFRNEKDILQSMLDKLFGMMVNISGKGTYNDLATYISNTTDFNIREVFGKYEVRGLSNDPRLKFDYVLFSIGGNVVNNPSVYQSAFINIINIIMQVNTYVTNVNTGVDLSQRQLSETDKTSLLDLYNQALALIRDLTLRVNALEDLFAQINSTVDGISGIISALQTSVNALKDENAALRADNEVLRGIVNSIAREVERLKAAEAEQNVRINENSLGIAANRDALFQNQFPHLYERLAYGTITPTEFAEFANEYAYVSMFDLIQDILNKAAQFLRNLNAFTAGNYASKNSAGLCDALSNPFAGLQGLINSALDIASKIKGIASSISSILSGGLGGLLDKAKAAFAGALNQIKNLGKFAAEMAKIENMKKMIEETVSNLVDSIKSKVQNIGKQFDSFISGVGTFMQNGPAKAIQNKIQTQINQLRNFFSDNNMKGLIDNAKNAVGRFVEQLKNLNETNFVEALGTVLYMACNLMSSIQDFLNKPVDAMKNMFSRVQGEFDKASLFSQQPLRESIAAGRPYIDPNQRRAETDRFRQSIRTGTLGRLENSGNIGNGQGGSYVPDNIVFQYSPERSAHPDPSEWEHLTFGGQVLDPVQAGQKFWDATFSVKMVDYGGGSIVPGESGIDRAIGYYGVKLEALERANSLVEALLEINAQNLGGAPSQMGSGKILITSGFRHQIYNQYLRNTGVGAARNSKHMQGIALDCIMGRGQFREAFIEMARKHGFGGIGRYNSFVHIDMGAVRSWNG